MLKVKRYAFIKNVCKQYLDFKKAFIFYLMGFSFLRTTDSINLVETYKTIVKIWVIHEEHSVP